MHHVLCVVFVDLSVLTGNILKSVFLEGDIKQFDLWTIPACILLYPYTLILEL